MLTNERCYEIKKYINQLLYNDGKDIKEEWKPMTIEEIQYYEKEYKYKLKEKKHSEDFQNRKNKAFEEIELVTRKYLPKEYWSDGYFSSDEFNEILEEISERILEEVNNLSIFDPRYYFLTLGGHHLSSPQYWIYEKLRTKQILKKKYKIDWNPKSDYYTEEYKEEIKKIQEKYKIPLNNYY